MTKNKRRLAAISFGIEMIGAMHGQVVGDPEFNHTRSPAKCACVYGTNIRALEQLDTDIRDMDKRQRAGKAMGPKR